MEIFGCMIFFSYMALNIAQMSIITRYNQYLYISPPPPFQLNAAVKSLEIEAERREISIILEPHWIHWIERISVARHQWPPICLWSTVVILVPITTVLVPVLVLVLVPVPVLVPVLVTILIASVVLLILYGIVIIVPQVPDIISHVTLPRGASSDMTNWALADVMFWWFHTPW